MDLILKILDWSEVWALIIPISILLFRRNENQSLRPVVIYIWLAFLINCGIDAIMTINIYFKNDFLSNNFLYNTHSVVRFACFSYYFIRLQPGSFVKIKRIISIACLLFVVFNFILFENFLNYDSFSGNLLTAEAYLLMIFCMLYYLAELKSDRDDLLNSPHFWIVTGLSVYVVVNFFVFLFYLPMLYVDLDLAINIWYIHNIAFIIFCLFISKAFYGTARYQHTV